MKQAVMTAPGTIEIRDVPEPKPAPGEVLLRVKRIGICGSDIHVWHGKHPYTSYPVVQGHEFSAVVEATGPGVTGLAHGRKVTALPQVVCEECVPCRRGDYHICDHLKVQGFQAPGCAQELFVTRAEKIVPLPDSFTFEQGALVEPAAVAVHAVGRAGDVAGKTVAVLGAGPIGNLVAQVARSCGAHVLATDLSEFRLEIGTKCGIKAVSNPLKETLKQAINRAFNAHEADIALDCVGVEDTINAAISAVGKGGIIVVVGVFGAKPVLNMGLVQDRELNIRGTLMYRYEDYVRAAALIAEDKIITQPLVSEHFPLEQYSAAYAFIDKRRDKSMKVFIDL